MAEQTPEASVQYNLVNMVTQLPLSLQASSQSNTLDGVTRGPNHHIVSVAADDFRYQL